MITDPSASSFSSYSETESRHLPLISGLPDDIALFCLARVPRKYHTVLKCVSKRWRDLVCSEEWWDYRQKNNLGESWIYALCRDKSTDQVSCYVLDPSSSRQACWKSICGLPPRCLKRKGMAFETIGKKLYLLGGCGWSEDATDEVYCYDVAMNTWSEAPSMSTARCYFGCVNMDGKIYSIGGYGLETSDPHSWDTYDPRTNSWESHSDPNIILDIEDSVVMGGKIYIRSRTSTIPPHVYIAVYDLSSGKWQQTDADMASGWLGPTVVVDDTIYVLDQSLGSKLMMWQKNTREWIPLCRLSPLLPRPPCQMVAIGRKIFIIGKGLSAVVLDINVGNADRMIASSSIPNFSCDDDVICCKCVSI
ncbi:F-box/kelch-repeat protein SKIP4-like [Chenopodium quinoa]|uniref:F-box domain-containing protein n=1 Tax=Chenopodium quinoa TaxID=63459 RepID=A0A803KZ88_CHEQI|nr:F-box/kelch-repeat protein SKIP4-like [Chenopodium quinoa]